jgi:putative aminopeptidase FrvX
MFQGWGTNSSRKCFSVATLQEEVACGGDATFPRDYYSDVQQQHSLGIPKTNPTARSPRKHDKREDNTTSENTTINRDFEFKVIKS